MRDLIIISLVLSLLSLIFTAINGDYIISAMNILCLVMGVDVLRSRQ